MLSSQNDIKDRFLELLVNARDKEVTAAVHHVLLLRLCTHLVNFY
jgi:hypothetical protein